MKPMLTFPSQVRATYLDASREEICAMAPATDEADTLPPTSSRSLVFDVILVSATLVLLVAAIVVGWRQYSQHLAREALIADLTTAKTAFQTYLREKKAAPPDSPPGVVPPGMAPYLATFAWSAPTPIGGNYRWVARKQSEQERGAPPSGEIALTAFSPSASLALALPDLLEIDRLIDDGNLETGDFRTGFAGWPTLHIRVKP